MKKVDIGVIGVGYWGKKVLSEYAQLTRGNPSVNLFGASDLSEDNLKFCEDFSLPLMTKSYSEILACREINAVHICTPSETHYEICREALEAGKHVIVEKPMTLNSREAYKLVDLAHEKGLILSVGHIFRFNNAIQKVRSLIRDGFLGDLFWFKLQWTALMPLMKGRDIITDLAPHPFDILNFLTNEWPSKITCRAKAYRTKEQEETAHIIAELDNGVMANMELSWLHPEKVREVSIMGSKGFVKIDCLTQEVNAFDNGNFYNIPVEVNNTIATELEHFAECIQKNHVSSNGHLNRNNGLIGAYVVKLLEVSRKSLEKERTERVETV